MMEDRQRQQTSKAFFGASGRVGDGKLARCTGDSLD